MAVLQQSQTHFANNQSSNTHYSNQLTTKPISSTSSIILALNLKFASHCWILDSGATDHMSSFLDFFIAYKTISPIPIRLPNGTHITANIVGTVCFSDSLVLHHVLYLPSFTFNLILVTKLTSDLHCFLTFTNKNCDI